MGLRRSFKLTNIAINSNFAQGITGWNLSQLANIAVNNGVLSCIATGVNAYAVNVIPNYANYKGHKLYYCANIKAQSSVSILLNDGTTQSQTNAPSNIVLTKASNIMTISTNANTLYTGLIDNSVSGWSEIQVSGFRVIDLTTILPTDILALSNANLKAWCDLNIPNWFDGTLSGGVMNGKGGLK